MVPELFGDVRHIWMKDLEDEIQHIHEYTPRGLRLGDIASSITLVESGFRNFNVPVGVLIPHEFVDFASSGTQLVFFNVLCHTRNECVGFGNNILFWKKKLIKLLAGHWAHHTKFRHLCFVSIFQGVGRHKLTGVPKLVAKVAIGFDFLHVQWNILSWGYSGDEGVSKTVGTVLFYSVQRIKNISLRFRHFATVCSSDKAVKIDYTEWTFARQFDSHHDHSSHPEKQNIVSRLQARSWVEPS
mmetsp:Transcript_9887/g.24641  ORF Transcript_9887/g.24641 Transcript_9887/m.24641 type:complete len:242 (-) Transcript_9887:2058-2783(-)